MIRTITKPNARMDNRDLRLLNLSDKDTFIAKHYQFIKTWQTSKNPEECARKLKRSVSSCKSWAHLIRTKGIPLRKFKIVAQDIKELRRYFDTLPKAPDAMIQLKAFVKAWQEAETVEEVKKKFSLTTQAAAVKSKYIRNYFKIPLKYFRKEVKDKP